MGLSDLFGKTDELICDIDLSEYFISLPFREDRYIASEHCVKRFSVMPSPPPLPFKGFTEKKNTNELLYAVIKIPRRIKTKKRLFEYLEKKYGFLKKTVNSPNRVPFVPPINPFYNLFNIIVDETTSVSVDLSIKDGSLFVFRKRIAVNQSGKYSVFSEPIDASDFDLDELLRQAPREIQSKYSNFTGENRKGYLPADNTAPRLCDCSDDKRHSFVSFGTHISCCLPMMTNYTVHRCIKCGYIHNEIFVPDELGDVVKQVVTEIRSGKNPLGFSV